MFRYYVEKKVQRLAASGGNDVRYLNKSFIEVTEYPLKSWFLTSKSFGHCSPVKPFRASEIQRSRQNYITAECEQQCNVADLLSSMPFAPSVI